MLLPNRMPVEVLELRLDLELYLHLVVLLVLLRLEVIRCHSWNKMLLPNRMLVVVLEQLVDPEPCLVTNNCRNSSRTFSPNKTHEEAPLRWRLDPVPLPLAHYRSSSKMSSPRHRRPKLGPPAACRNWNKTLPRNNIHVVVPRRHPTLELSHPGEEHN